MLALLQGAFALLARQMGRILNTAFGWATAMLFGKVPSNRQSILSIIALVAVVWLVLLVGIAFPTVGTMLLAFVPLPESIDENWVRLGMFIAAALLPAVTGGLTLLLQEPEDRPNSVFGSVRTVLQGYPYTLGLGIAIVAMIFVAPIMKARDLMKGWSNRHVPVVVEADDYFDVVDHLQQILSRAGFETERGHASPLIRWPTRLFTWLAGTSADSLVARELQVLRSPEVEVMLHPSDLVIHADGPVASRVFAQVNEHLAFSKAHLAWTKEAQEIESELTQIAQQLKAQGSSVPAAGQRKRLTDVRRRLERLNLEGEEWEVVFREVLLVEQLLGERQVSESQIASEALAPLVTRSLEANGRGAAIGAEAKGNATSIQVASIAGAAVAFATLVWQNWRDRRPR